MTKRFHVDPSEQISVYEFDPTEVVSETPPNIIVIRARMNVEVAGRVQGEMAKRNAANQTEGYVGVLAVALFLHNILGWSGPDFDDLPCTPENICALPPPELDPFIETVLNRIGELNNHPAGPSPKSRAASTSENAGAADSRPSTNGASASNDRQPSLSHQLATTTSRSPLRSAITGRQNRSEDSTPIS